MTALVAEDLGLYVGDRDGRWLVRHLDAEFVAGTVTAVVGPNGAGKSTLLRALCALLQPREGRVRLGDKAIGAWRSNARARTVAYLPQSTTLVHDLRVRDIVALGRAPYRGRWPIPEPHIDAHVTRALQQVDAESLIERRASTLSGGERQRIMIARMLATGATHLLMDEPSAALDVGQALSLHALLRALAAEGRAIVIALHDLDAARRVADEAVCLDRRAGGGAFHLGAAAKVLGASVLAPAFDVEVHEADGALRFERRAPDGGD